MPFVLISAPIYDRAWILEDWFESIENQDFRMENIGFQFEAGYDDEPTIEALMEFHARHPEVRCFDISINKKETHVAHLEGQRMWKKDRYGIMANFRNNLLNRAICKSPDRLFSLDTDILLEDPTTISTLYQMSGNFDAVSPLCYMTPEGTDFPNTMTWGQNGQGYRKSSYPLGSIFKSDIIMAVVMMSKKAFEKSRYFYHPQGEDLGWSLDCMAKNIQLYSASSVYTPHIMSRAALLNYKENGDSRSPLLIK